MSSTQGTTKNLSLGRVQALQAILSSVSPNDADLNESDGSPMTENQIRRISNKLGEIFGEDLNIVDDDTRNEKGELVNEEGLPIIEISEADSILPDAAHAPAASFDDPYILPQWTLSPEEKTRRKAEREHILDLLEEEERLEAEREEMSERERFREDLERRKLAAKSEMDDIKKAKELQKKMGRALVRNVVQSKEQKEKEAAQELRDADTARTAMKPLKSRKSVTFADGVDQGIDEEVATEMAGGWNDVIPARLNEGKASLWANNQPMRMDIVERRPGGGLRSPPPSRAALVPDSDDESIPETPPNDSMNVGVGENDIDDSRSDDDESNGFLDDEELVSDWDDGQFDTARHQREVALEYYEKRKTIGAQAASAMRAHTHDEGDNAWDQPVVPLEATLSAAPPKPPISKFKASLASPKTSTLASHSLGPYIVPSSQTQALGRTIRYGKLENGQLVGGEEGESEDEDDGLVSNQEEILRLLTQGEVTNAGPAPSEQETASTPGKAPYVPGALSHLGAEPHPTSPAPITNMFSPGSKGFSVSNHSTLHSPLSSALNTPIAATERSSPKAGTPVTSSPSPDINSMQARQPPMNSFVKERLRRPGNDDKFTGPSPSSAPAAVQHPSSAIPSITKSPAASSAPNSSFHSMIIESSSSKYAPIQKPPGVMNSEVRKTESASRVVDTGTKSTERKKVSRFLAERG